LRLGCASITIGVQHFPQKCRKCANTLQAQPPALARAYRFAAQPQSGSRCPIRRHPSPQCGDARAGNQPFFALPNPGALRTALTLGFSLSIQRPSAAPLPALPATAWGSFGFLGFFGFLITWPLASVMGTR